MYKNLTDILFVHFFPNGPYDRICYEDKCFERFIKGVIQKNMIVNKKYSLVYNFYLQIPLKFLANQSKQIVCKLLCLKFENYFI